MPKKKASYSYAKRLKDRQRKREERLRKTSPDDISADNTVPRGSVDGAVAAPPSAFLGQVSMGFPLKEEKPLARVQASLREKMHPPAPRLPSPRGSRLFVRNEGKAPSPDSPAWVCAPARAPGPDTEHVSGPAGQAQLEGFREKCTSRIQKDEGNLNETKTKTKRNLNLTKTETERNMTRNESEIVTEQKCKNKINHTFFRSRDTEPACESDAVVQRVYEQSESSSGYNRSVQGSFHQGHAMFGENAGTQCVANCLGAIAYHKLKNTENWGEFDMNIVLTTGNELYTYLQSSSTINDRYLLISELPQFLECFDHIFEFKCNESIASLISLGIDEPSYDDFNAHTLIDALQISLSDNDGCFVCFSGNTFLVGKTHGKYFIFDSHSRTCDGYQTPNGKSIRIIHDCLFDVQQHILSLALSMGLTNIVDCEITGVNCLIMQLNDPASIKKMIQDSETDVNTPHVENNECQSMFESDDSVEYLSEEKSRPAEISSENMLFEANKRKICEELNLIFSEERCNLNTRTVEIEGTEMHCQNIEGDGNCFFRAISYCVSGSEKNHEAIRLATCRYLVENEAAFQSLQRNTNISMSEYMQMSNMCQTGTWATEMEIIAVAAMLHINIYTFSCERWLLYSEAQVISNCETNRGSIFLHHINENHYNVVECKPRLYRGNMDKKIENYRRRLQKMKEKYWGNNEYRKRYLERKREAYQKDSNFKKHSLLRSSQRYNTMKKDILMKRRIKYKSSLQHSIRLKEASRKRYKTNICHQKSLKSASVSKYKSNLHHKKSVKKASISKYRLNSVHRQRVKESSTKKYKMDPVHRQAVKDASTKKYKEDPVHRQAVKDSSTKKYKVDPVHRQAVKDASTKKYKVDQEHRTALIKTNTQKYKKDPQYQIRQKEYEKNRYNTDKEHRQNVTTKSKEKYKNEENTRNKKKENAKKSRLASKSKFKNEYNVIGLFKQKSKECPDYVCCCCHRLLFGNQVQKCDIEVYESKNNANDTAEICIQNDYLHSCSMSCPPDCTRSALWICKTCHRKILSGNIPAEAAVNKMKLEHLPNELIELNSLERQLISLHIPFMRVTNLPQGKQRNIHGLVVCVPTDLKKATSLPRTADQSMVLRVKLKRKISYKGYQEYQFVNPHHLIAALDFLIKNNEWYKDVQMNKNWERRIDTNDGLIEANNTEDDDEEQETLDIDTQDANTPATMDTCLQPVDVVQEVLCHYFDDVYNLAPGEGRNPVKMLQEDGNEAKTFPYLFPSGQNTWNENRDIRITLCRYFHNRLMNADNRFARDSNYIFFSQYMSELNQVIEKTQISVRKSFAKTTTGKTVTPEMLQDPILLSKMINKDEAIRFMQPIRGTPAYWQSAQKDLFAMLRQIGIPTWFCSFSAAEFRWNSTIEAILRQQCDNRSVDEMNWTEKSEILRNNPVTVARMFEHRFHVFLRDVIMSPSEPIGKVVDYFQRVEFQQRGSPHMHCLFWIDGAPKLDQDGEIAVCKFIDRYVTCEIPSENEDPELRKIVLDVQQHSKKHSNSCRKKGTECRFNFPRPPSEQTFITQPVNNTEVIDEEKEQMPMEKQVAKQILQTVWERIQDASSDYSSCDTLFNELGLSQEIFQMAYNTVTSKQAIVLQRNPNEIWTNQYNPCLLKCWDANLDIQFVLDPFTCIVYIISYISKSEREMGLLLKQTSVEAQEGNLSARKTMKKIGSAYLHHREVSAQEAVYRVCNLRMKECSRKTVFIPVGENPTRLTKPLHQLKSNQEQDDDDIWMTNIVERYENRPNDKDFANMCLAQFCSDFRVLAKSQVPNTCKDGVYELQNGKGFVQKRIKSSPAIIRYPRFSPEKMPEKYYQSILQLFLPYWNQDHLKPPKYDLFQTFYETGRVRLKQTRSLQFVKQIVDNNRQIYCKNEQIINEAEETFEHIGEPEDAWALLCPETETNRRSCIERKERVEEDEGHSEVPDLIEEHSADILYQVQHSNRHDNMLPMLRSLNETQSEIFYFVRNWCLQKSIGEKPEPFYVFVTGGAGTGKSHLIKTVQYEADRLLSKTLQDPEGITVLLTALTGTAAFNIGGNTIHHTFALNKYLPFPYEPLHEQRLNSIRVRLQDLQILVIDEVSMVYKRLLYYVHERLVQIKKCKRPFGGVSVIAVGDFFQLPPVKQKKNERLYNNNVSYPEDFWKELFKVVELKEIMRQREDVEFATMLNRLRIRTKEEILDTKLIEHFRECVREGPEDVLHVFATNDEVNDYNLSMLNHNCMDLVEIKAKDFKKDKTSGKLSLLENPVSTKRSEGLPSSILLGVTARVMLTRNVDVEDGLVNGVMGFISEIKQSNGNTGETTGIYVVFDNTDVGKKSGKKNAAGVLEVMVRREEENINGRGRQHIIRHQFPLQLAWACTAHKVQGMTAKEVVVNLDKMFAPGQAYVALSRVTTKKGLSIQTSFDDITDLFKKKIYAEPEVKDALLEMENLIEPIIYTDDNFCKTIILHNIQSLPAHFEDLKTDQRFQRANFICLTETWLQKQKNEAFRLENYNSFRKDRFESYGNTENVCVELKNSKGGGVFTYSHIHESVIEINLPVNNIEVVAVLLDETIAILTVYRPTALPVHLFLLSMQKVISYVKEHYDRVIILGDFNEDTAKIGPIQECMCINGFTQYVTFSTTEGGTSIDHVYGYGIPRTQIHLSLLPTYYSYHEAVILKLQLLNPQLRDDLH